MGTAGDYTVALSITSIALFESANIDSVAAVKVTFLSPAEHDCYCYLQRADGANSAWIDVTAEL